MLVREKSYVHSYPHCWRCRKPLMYKAVSSWFVRVTEIRDRMVELNQEITWTPAHIKDGIFGKWLEALATGRFRVTASGVRRFPCGYRMTRSTRVPMLRLGCRAGS